MPCHMNPALQKTTTNEYVHTSQFTNFLTLQHISQEDNRMYYTVSDETGLLLKGNILANRR